jgi:tellurite resistance protein TerC
MGTWTLWIAFNIGVALVLLLDLGLFHRRAHAISIREAALESAAWVALSVGFGIWILFSHGRGPGLEFFTGYLIEKSLSVDNVFVFLLIFQYFRVDARYQHRMLFWGVLGALVLRGAMVGAGVILIERFSWILYLFGAFLIYAGAKWFRAEHSVHPEKNPVVQWVHKVLPMSQADAGPRLFTRENGRWVATPLLLVVLVLETTDLVFAVDSIPAVFGVTRDPFVVYTSNVCAILGLRALYFLLAGVLPYLSHLDEGLAVVLMFIGAKMLAEPWVHIPTGVSLAIVAGVIGVAVLSSVIARIWPRRAKSGFRHVAVLRTAPLLEESIQALASPDPARRAEAAGHLSTSGNIKTSNWLDLWRTDADLQALIVPQHFVPSGSPEVWHPRITTGIAVFPEVFEKIRAANGSPPLAKVPPDQDASEIELHFTDGVGPPISLDILTTKEPDGDGAVARYLKKFGEGIQQLEIDVTNVDRATQILRTRFQIEPIYPTTRPGANSTRVNFFLVNTWNNQKVLVELVEQPDAKT